MTMRLIGLVCLALASTCAAAAAACSTFTEPQPRSYRSFYNNTPVGDILIGYGYSDSSSAPSQLIQVDSSHCLLLDRDELGGRKTMQIWIANNGSLEAGYIGNFLYIDSATIETTIYSEVLTFYRNANPFADIVEGTQIEWRDVDLNTIKPSSILFNDRKISIDRDKYNKIKQSTSRQEFEALAPGFAQHLSVKNENDYYEKFDLMTYFRKTKHRTELLGKIEDFPGYLFKRHVMAIGFVGRPSGGKSFLDRPRFAEINIKGPCHYIVFDSPYEPFQKQVAIKFKDSTVDCPLP